MNYEVPHSPRLKMLFSVPLWSEGLPEGAQKQDLQTWRRSGP